MESLFMIVPFVFLLLDCLFVAILTFGVPELPYLQVELGTLKTEDFRRMDENDRKTLRTWVLAFFTLAVILTGLMSLYAVWKGFDERGVVPILLWIAGQGAVAFTAISPVFKIAREIYNRLKGLA